MVKLLVADDEQKICQLIRDFFATRGYDVLLAHDGPTALSMIRTERPHLVFLDVRMPGLNGLDVLKQAKAIDRTTKIIVLTALEDDETVARARKLGAADYVIKPFTLDYLESEVLAKVNASLYEDLREINEQLKDSLERMKHVVRGIVAAFSAVVSKMDPEYTHEHIMRSVDYAGKIIKQLRQMGVELGEGGGEAQEEILLAGVLLHDIGKIFTPKEILYKPGPLTDDEWKIMRRHPVDGAEVLERIAGLKSMAKSVRHHHERYDGGGYPDGLKGAQIPVGARIACVVDAFDAMVSDRPYRKGISVQAAIEELTRNRGTQFDPQVVDAMLALYKEEGGLQLHRGPRHAPAPPAPSSNPPVDSRVRA